MATLFFGEFLKFFTSNSKFFRFMVYPTYVKVKKDMKKLKIPNLSLLIPQYIQPQLWAQNQLLLNYFSKIQNGHQWDTLGHMSMGQFGTENVWAHPILGLKYQTLVLTYCPESAKASVSDLTISKAQLNLSLLWDGFSFYAECLRLLYTYKYKVANSWFNQYINIIASNFDFI